MRHADGLAITICGFLLIVLFMGEPDIADAIMVWLRHCGK